METPFSNIFYRRGPVPGARYVSGSMVFDEMFAGGRLLSRYWNPNGQVLPEMHEKLSWAVYQPADTFQLSVDNRSLAGGYAWESAGLSPDPAAFRARLNADGQPLPFTHEVVSLKHAEAGIAVKVHTRLDGGSFLVRWLEITNLNQHAVGLSAVSPFAASSSVALLPRWMSSHPSCASTSSIILSFTKHLSAR